MRCCPPRLERNSCFKLRYVFLSFVSLPLISQCDASAARPSPPLVRASACVVRSLSIASLQGVPPCASRAADVASADARRPSRSAVAFACMGALPLNGLVERSIQG